MDLHLLMSSEFWGDSSSIVMGKGEGLPNMSPVEGHVWFQTSGTVGAPKWIGLSKRALMVSAVAVNEHLWVTKDSCWGLALPLRHVGGFGVVVRAYEAGCRLTCTDSDWDAAKFTDWIKEEGVTHTSLVPTQVHDLVKAGLSCPDSLKAVVVGAGKLRADIGQAARSLGWPVLATYGMTESGSQIATQPLAALQQDYQPVPIPILPIWNVRLDDQQRLQIDGEALFTGSMEFVNGEWSYEPRGPGFYTTSDRVKLEVGCITPLGRADLQVKVLGELVDLMFVERELLQASDGILDREKFVVVAVPDERREHVLVPLFEESCNAGVVDVAVHRYRDKAEGIYHLEPPIKIDALPRTELGKIRRGACRDWVIEKRKA